MAQALEKFEACMLLSTVGDAVGNSDDRLYTSKDPSFVHQAEQATLFKFLRFVADGGVTVIDTPKLGASDSTTLHLATCFGLIDHRHKNVDLKKVLSKNYLDAFKDFGRTSIEYKYKSKHKNAQTVESIKRLRRKEDPGTFEYSYDARGYDASIRCMCIGLAHSDPSDLDKLIEYAVTAASITHNNGTAFLGAITSALFVALAVQGVPPERWCFELLQVLDDGAVERYLRASRPEYIQLYLRDIKEFREKWNTYIEDSFDDNKRYNAPMMRRYSPMTRLTYYFNNFASSKDAYYPGQDADDSVIISYDALLLAGNNFELLVYTAMVHIGASNATGSMAAAWYGAAYGFSKVPPHLLNTLMSSDEVKEVGRMLYHVYHAPRPTPKEG